MKTANPKLPFKEHILSCRPYKGGSTRSEAGADKKIYKLSSNENLLGPSPKALKAMKKKLGQLHEYDYQDDSIFSTALACSVDFRLEPTQFITANSGMELLDLICRGFLESGDECIISSPTFMAYKSFANLSGAAVIDVPLIRTGYALDVDAILEAVNERTKMIFVASPNNPTGTIVTKEQLDKLFSHLPPEVIVVYDEVYHHYVKNFGYARALDYIEQSYPVIGLHSFSKAYGLAGLRLGYGFSRPDIADYLGRLRRPFMINSLAVEAGIAALSDHDHLQRTVELVISEKQWLYQGLRKLCIPFTPSHANYILFRAPYEAAHFATDMLQGGVMVRTGDVFGVEDSIRVTIGTREADNAFIKLLKLLI